MRRSRPVLWLLLLLCAACSDIILAEPDADVDRDADADFETSPADSEDGVGADDADLAGVDEADAPDDGTPDCGPTAVLDDAGADCRPRAVGDACADDPECPEGLYYANGIC